MMAMEQQLSQLSQMVTKAKKPGKKSVSFEKSVSFSDDPPSSSGVEMFSKDKALGSFKQRMYKEGYATPYSSISASVNGLM